MWDKIGLPNLNVTKWPWYRIGTDSYILTLLNIMVKYQSTVKLGHTCLTRQGFFRGPVKMII